jgi:hypothetical protein
VTTDELRREWCRLYALGKSQADTLTKVGRQQLTCSDVELANLIADHRATEREWDRIDDLLLERDAEERDAAELPGFSL